MIRLEDLSKRYGERPALDRVSLSVGQGEVFAYLGPNGSGKTTTINILTGLATATSGRAFIGGFDIATRALQAKRCAGLVSQVVNLDGDLTVRENLDIHGRLFAMPATARKARIKELLASFDLADREDSLVKSLSGGLKRRLMIARAMLHEPKVLFLDEPSVGLDPTIRRKIWSMVRKIRDLGTTVFLTTHYIEEAEFLADRVAFLESGRLVVVDTPRRLMDALGAWAVDDLSEDGSGTRYFQTREEAGAFIAGREEGCSLRRVNLEDAFMRMTGKKVVP